MVKQPVSYWIVRWGGNIRGPYDKTSDLHAAVAMAFGHAAATGPMKTRAILKSLGTLVATLRTEKGFYTKRAMIVDNKNWIDTNGDPVPEEVVAKMPRDGAGWPK